MPRRGYSKGYSKTNLSAVAKALEKAKGATGGAIGGVKKYYGDIEEENKKNWESNEKKFEFEKYIGSSSGMPYKEKRTSSLLGALRAAKAGGIAGFKKVK